MSAAAVVDVYLVPERYNPRLRATVPGAWLVVLDTGAEIAICREHEARSAEEARAIWESPVPETVHHVGCVCCECATQYERDRRDPRDGA